MNTNFFPDNLERLGQSLCPELGSQGACVDHTTVKIGNLLEKKKELIFSMMQDIVGGIMWPRVMLERIQYRRTH